MKMKHTLLAAAALSLLSTTASAVDWGGYFRVGPGQKSTTGPDAKCFGANMEGGTYRLGNECDNYAEPSIALPFGDTNKVWGKWKLTVALQNKGKQDAESTTDGSFNFLHRENYFSAGGFFGRGALENASLWVGQRFYNRHDIHMNDYYYWNNSGTGAGIEEITTGPVKLSLAYFQNGGNANPATDIVSKRYSVRFYDIDVNPGGKLEGELVLLAGSSATSTASKGSGQMLFVQHTQNGLLGGFNKLALILGKNQGAAFEWLPTYASGGEQKGSSWRVHDHLSFDFAGTGWTGTATASYAVWDPDGNDKWTWTSFGVRPQYNFTENFSIAVEAGVDSGKNGAAGTTARMTKLTVAPQLALSRGVWARPVLRAFVTHANWNDVAQAAGVANGVFGDKKSGTTFGVQAEAWW